MGEVLVTPRRQIDWGKMGAYAAEPLQAQQNVYNQLIPLLFKHKLEQQMQSDLLDKLIQGGNGPQGDFDISIGPGGITYKQKSPKEKQESEVIGREPRLANVLSYIRESIPSGASPEGILKMVRPERFTSAPEQTAISSTVKTAMGLRPKQTLEQKSKAQVNVAVQKDAMTRANKLQELIPVLDHFDNLMQALPVEKGITGKITGMKTAFSGWTGQDPFAATAIAQADALRPQIARGFGDVGNLSVPEQQTAKKFVALTTDPLDTRLIKSIAGYVFIKNKVQNSINKAGLQNDPNITNTMATLDSRISDKYTQAKKMGIDMSKLNKFLGMAGSSTKDLEKQSPISEVDIQHTMQKHGLSRDEVLRRLGR